MDMLVKQVRVDMYEQDTHDLAKDRNEHITLIMQIRLTQNVGVL